MSVTQALVRALLERDELTMWSMYRPSALADGEDLQVDANRRTVAHCRANVERWRSMVLKTVLAE